MIMGSNAGGPVWPTRFMKGVGMSVWQNSSDACSNWTTFAAERKYFGQQKVLEAWRTSNGFWDRFESDITLTKKLGANSFRFSFEWSRLEPTGPGQVDQTAVDRFHKILDCIESHGMEPMVTLHHFTHPQWFEKLGGFAKEENIVYFLEHCKRVFSWYGKRVRLWATFNEPTCFAFVGYIVGLWAPGSFCKFKQAGEVLLTLMKSHCVVYKVLKSMPGGPEACIGLVHQHIKFIPRSKHTPHIRLMCDWMTYWFGSEVLLRFFSKGEFEWKVPFKGVVLRFFDADAPKLLDWWGINYYSRPCVDWKFGMGASHDNEPVSDTHFRVYPQGLYDSIADASILKRPIYITETGLADKQDNYRRQFITSHFNMLLKAINDGYDVRGVYYWTLMDNIEWHEGFNVKFGLYEWDPVIQRTKDLRLRDGGKALVEFYAEWPDSISAIKEHAASAVRNSFMSQKSSTPLAGKSSLSVDEGTWAGPAPIKVHATLNPLYHTNSNVSSAVMDSPLAISASVPYGATATSSAGPNPAPNPNSVWSPAPGTAALDNDATSASSRLVASSHGTSSGSGRPVEHDQVSFRFK